MFVLSIMELLKENNMSITELQRITHLSRPTLVKLKYGNSSTTISTETLNTICKTFNVTPSELFKEVDDDT